MNQLMKDIDSGKLPVTDVMNILDGGLDLEQQLFPSADYPIPDSLIEHYDIERDLQLLTEEDPITGALLGKDIYDF